MANSDEVINNEEHVDEANGNIYRCKYCERTFTTSQALGGHQNGHRRERAAEKRSQREAEYLAMHPPPPPPPRTPIYSSSPFPSPYYSNSYGHPNYGTPQAYLRNAAHGWARHHSYPSVGCFYGSSEVSPAFEPRYSAQTSYHRNMNWPPDNGNRAEMAARPSTSLYDRDRAGAFRGNETGMMTGEEVDESKLDLSLHL